MNCLNILETGQIDINSPRFYHVFMSATFNKTDSLSQNDIDKIAGLLDKTFTDRLAPLATKDFVKEEIAGVRADMGGMEQRLKGYIDEGIETVMEGIDNISKQLAEKEKVEKLAQWARVAGEKIGVKLEI